MEYLIEFYKLSGSPPTITVVSTMGFSNERMMRKVWSELRQIGIETFVRIYGIYHETYPKDTRSGETVTMRQYPGLYRIRESGKTPYYKTIFDSKDDVPYKEEVK